MEDITNVLDMSMCYCLNEQNSHTFRNLFESGDFEHTGLKSNADEQLIIQLSFRQQVTLSNIEYLIESGSDECPRVIKLYLNKTNLDFSSIENEKHVVTHKLGKFCAVQKFGLGREWQNVDTVTLFIETNHGAELTSLKHLRIYGKPLECLNVNNIRKGCCC